jgi:hypothetical protein
VHITAVQSAGLRLIGGAAPPATPKSQCRAIAPSANRETVALARHPLVSSFILLSKANEQKSAIRRIE